MLSLAVICISSVLTFFAVELGYRLLNPELGPSVGAKSVRTMLFARGDNFRNEEAFFRYYPNRDIRSVTLYSKPEPETIADIVVEYDYVIRTNNAGLVMAEGIEVGENVILVVGDSFTEGQGATPWFYELEANWNGSAKLVNLGIMGTGPMQWWLLAERLVQDYDLRVEGVIINVILGDLVRSIWNFSEESIACLSIGLCKYRGDMQGVDFSLDYNHAKIRQLVLENSKKPTVTQILVPSHGFDRFKYVTKELLKKSKVLVAIKGYFKPTAVIEDNKKAIVKIAQLSGSNAQIVAINTKEFSLKPLEEHSSYLADTLHALSANENIPLSWCNPGAEGFHINDGHPNEKGYSRIRQCTLEAAKKLQKSVNEQADH